MATISTCESIPGQPERPVPPEFRTLNLDNPYSTRELVDVVNVVGPKNPKLQEQTFNLPTTVRVHYVFARKFLGCNVHFTGAKIFSFCVQNLTGREIYFSHKSWSFTAKPGDHISASCKFGAIEFVVIGNFNTTSIRGQHYSIEYLETPNCDMVPPEYETDALLPNYTDSDSDFEIISGMFEEPNAGTHSYCNVADVQTDESDGISLRTLAAIEESLKDDNDLPT